MTFMRCAAFRFLIVFSACGLFAQQAAAQIAQTQLYAVSPPGAQQGQTVEVVVTNGKELDDLDRLLFSHPGITAKQKTQDSGGKQVPVANTFVVTVSPEVPVGYYEIRAAGYFGISNPRTFAIDDRPEVAEIEPNNDREKAQPVELGTIVNARSNTTADVDFFKLHLAAGQRLVVTAEAQRIDSKMQAQIELLDANGRRLERSRNGYRNDPVLDYTSAADADYFLRVTEFTYRGNNDYFYRLNINSGPHLDFVIPASGVAGTTAKYTLFGRNLPGGAPSGVKLDGVELQKREVEIALPARDSDLALAENITPEESSVDGFAYRLKGETGSSNAVYIHYADAPVAMEVEPNDEPAQVQQVTLPIEITGQFASRLDLDAYQFEAKAGEVYFIEVFGQRLGKTTDPRFLVEQITKNDKGEEQVKRLTDQDDQKVTIGGDDFNTRHRDPQWKFAVPADGTYRVTVSDRYRENRGHANLVYRLAIRRANPGFRLVAFASQPNPAANQPGQTGVLSLRKGDNAFIDVFVHRFDEYNGTVFVNAEGLPEGVTCRGAVIGTDQSTARLVLSAKADAPVQTANFRLVGEAVVDHPTKVRELAAAEAGIKPATDAIAPLQKAVAQIEPQVVAATTALKAPMDALAKAKAAQTAAETDLKAKTAALTKADADQKTVTTALATATEAKTKSDAEVKAKTDAVNSAKAELAKAPEDQAKKDAVTQAEQQLAAATTAQKAATDELTKMTQTKTKADADLKTATDQLNASKTAKTTADQNVTNADAAYKKVEADLKAKTDALNAAKAKLAAGEKALADANALVAQKQQEKIAAAKTVKHPARSATLVWPASPNTGEDTDARMTRNLVVSVMDAAAGFQVDLESPEPKLVVSQSRQLLLPVKVEKRNSFDANVTLTFAGFDNKSKLQVENKPLNKGEAAGVRRIFIPKDAPLGAYTVYLTSQAQESYTRNPKAIAAAQAKVDEAVANVTASEAANKTAIENVNKSNAEMTAADQKFKQTVQALPAADKAVKDAQAVVTKAEADLKTAQDAATAADADVKAKTDALAKAEGDEAKKAAETALTQANEAKQKADAALKTAQELLAKSQADLKTKTEALAKADAEKKAAETALAQAKETKTKADAAAKTAAAALKTAQTAKANADKIFTNVNNANKAKNVNVTAPSTPVLLIVKAAPVELTAAVPNGGAIKKGAALEAKVTIKRINGFTGPVEVSLPLPPGTVGLKTEPLTIPADQTEGVLKIQTEAGTTEGQLANMVIRGEAEFDGPAAVDVPVTIKVDP